MAMKSKKDRAIQKAKINLLNKHKEVLRNHHIQKLIESHMNGAQLREIKQVKNRQKGQLNKEKRLEAENEALKKLRNQDFQLEKLSQEEDEYFRKNTINMELEREVRHLKKQN